MPRLSASLSLDLDNQWSYMKTHGDTGWESFPSYLDVVVPRVLEMLDQLNLKITFFIVGQDAALESNHPTLQAIADRGHEVGNHSFHHEPWLHLYTDQQLADELTAAEQHIAAATGQSPLGFRGPGFSFSVSTLRELAARGYQYDCSTFPTFIGPLARVYYFMKSRLTTQQKSERQKLFGGWREGFRSIRPYYWRDTAPPLLEIPVTTMPIFRVPFHLSYIHYLAGYSHAVAMAYFHGAVCMCRLFRVEPSVLLHPLDFLGQDDKVGLDFFPAMHMPAARKLQLMRDALQVLNERFEVVPMLEHARRMKQRLSLPSVETVVNR